MAELPIDPKQIPTEAEVKEQAASRWIATVNAEGGPGLWRFAMAHRVGGPSGAIVAACGT